MKQSKIAGIIGTVVVHLIVLLLLFYIKLSLPEQEVEGGVPVMLGNMELAEGNPDNYELTEVDVLPQPEPSVPEEPAVDAPAEDAVITQQDEPTIKMEEKKEVKEKKEKKKEKKKPEEKKTVKPKPQTKPVEKPKEKTEAEKRAEAERIAAQAAASKISGAFGKGSKMKGQGEAKGDGVQGTPTGTSSSGSPKGGEGFGSVDLNGRHLGPGGLPKPVYNVQEEGMVVVTILVDSSGKVIRTSINKRTNTVSTALRKAAEEAAAKARFNTVKGFNDQSGTIVYYFKLN